MWTWSGDHVRTNYSEETYALAPVFRGGQIGGRSVFSSCLEWFDARGGDAGARAVRYPGVLLPWTVRGARRRRRREGGPLTCCSSSVDSSRRAAETPARGWYVILVLFCRGQFKARGGDAGARVICSFDGVCAMQKRLVPSWTAAHDHKTSAGLLRIFQKDLGAGDIPFAET